MSAYFKRIRDFGPEDFHIQNLIRNQTFKELAQILPKLSFILANFLNILIFEYFFNIRAFGIVALSIYIIGMFLSFSVIKTNLLLKFGSNSTKVQNQDQTIDNNEKKKKIEYLIGFWNVFLLFSRYLFFNVLNDLFIATLFWTAFFGIAYIIYQSVELVVLPQEFDFLLFLGVISMISLMSGFFQLYIPSYQKNITEKIQKSLNTFIVQNIQSINPWEFQNFLETTNNSPELNKIVSDVIGTTNLPKLIHASSGFLIKGRGTFNTVNIFNLESPATRDPLMVFVSLENIIEKDHPDILTSLRKEIKLYFSWKHQQYLSNIHSLDLDEARKIIFSNIIFFDESFASYINLNFKSTSIEKKSEKFQDYYLSYVYTCIFDFFDILMNERLIR
ncbi:MAG: hypothetical protein JXA08_04285 [Methanomicrobiaceae archaeon]|nr:hypothetical protein [Methanomicrobiaceae archaeon]